MSISEDIKLLQKSRPINFNTPIYKIGIKNIAKILEKCNLL